MAAGNSNTVMGKTDDSGLFVPLGAGLDLRGRYSQVLVSRSGSKIEQKGTLGKSQGKGAII